MPARIALQYILMLAAAFFAAPSIAAPIIDAAAVKAAQARGAIVWDVRATPPRQPARPGRSAEAPRKSPHTCGLFAANHAGWQLEPDYFFAAMV